MCMSSSAPSTAPPPATPKIPAPAPAPAPPPSPVVPGGPDSLNANDIVKARRTGTKAFRIDRGLSGLNLPG